MQKFHRMQKQQAPVKRPKKAVFECLNRADIFCDDVTKLQLLNEKKSIHYPSSV